MRKTYALRPEGKHPDRVLDAVKHDIRKYMKRERRRELPEGAHYWDFDCRFGADAAAAASVHPAQLTSLLDAMAAQAAPQCYVELLARPGVRQARAPGAASGPTAAATGEGAMGEAAMGETATGEADSGEAAMDEADTGKAGTGKADRGEADTGAETKAA